MVRPFFSSPFLSSLMLAAITAASTLPAWAATGPASPVVGRMGGTEVRADQMTDLIGAQTPEVRNALATQPDTMKDLIRAELLRRAVLGEARQAGWDKRANIAIAIERAKEQALIESYLNARAEPEAAYPAAADIQSAYEKNIAQFQVPPLIRLAQILIRLPENPPAAEVQRAEATVREVSQKLSAAGDFAALARQYSQDQGSKDKGGELDWLAEANLSPLIREEAAALKPGGVSRALKTAFGWQIVKVLERRAAAVRPLAEVRDAIVKGLRDARLLENRQRLIDAINQRSPPVIDDKMLKEIRVQ